MATPTPVILDTDIGTDIDDTWALAMLLKSPRLDPKLVVSASGDTEYRARLAARILEGAGRADVPVGVGIPSEMNGGQPQARPIESYPLSAYPGAVHADGVDAMIDAILASPERVTLVSIGPLTNVAAALEREPRIASRARLVGMHGSVRIGYRGGSEIAAEYNVLSDIPACRRALAADWEVTLTPLDTCGLVRLEGAPYRRVRHQRDPVLDILFEHVGAWLDAVGAPSDRIESHSTTLYDTVAVYLAESEDLLEIEELGLRVDDQGYTRIDPAARPVRVATGWRDHAAFHDFLVERLVS